MKVVCLTCDAYSSIVPNFVHFFHKMWPQCPWELVIVTDKIKIKVSERVYYTGANHVFSNRLIKFVDEYLRDDDEHILVMLEDYIIKSVNHALVTRAYDMMVRDRDIAMIRLYPKPGPSKPYNTDPDIGEIDRGDLYVASLQAAMWRVDMFRSILGPAEDPWQTEEAGSWRVRHSSANNKFLATYQPAIDYHNYCSKGILDVEVTRWMKENA